MSLVTVRALAILARTVTLVSMSPLWMCITKMFYLFDLNVCFSKGNPLFVYIAFAFLACGSEPFKHTFTPGP